jgi:hypothetical protein
MKKTEGQKSRDTVPLTLFAYKCEFKEIKTFIYIYAVSLTQLQKRNGFAMQKIKNAFGVNYTACKLHAVS